MIYGVEAAAESQSAPTPPPPYTASAVTFNSAALVLASLTCTDNQFFGFAGWFRTDWTARQIAWVVDPDNNYNSAFGNISFPQFAIGGNNGSSFLITNTASTPDTTWHHFIGAGQTNFAAHSKIIKLKLDGVDASNNINDNAASFNAQSNGLPFWFGSDDTLNVWGGDMCDVSIWAGINLLTAGDISSTTIQLFRTTGGAPVNPSVAIAALGHPPIFLSGNAASFASNTLGTSGAFTPQSGTITDAATHP